MKKILIGAVVAISFNGCTTAIKDAIKNPTLTRLYDTTKAIHVRGREIIISNYDLLDDETKKRLEKIDGEAELLNSIITHAKETAE